MRPSAARKHQTNLAMDAKLVEETIRLDVDVSETGERVLVIELKKSREAKWLAENRHAIIAFNDWIEKNGMPYDEYRQGIWHI